MIAAHGAGIVALSGLGDPDPAQAPATPPAVMVDFIVPAPPARPAPTRVDKPPAPVQEPAKPAAPVPPPPKKMSAPPPPAPAPPKAADLPAPAPEPAPPVAATPSPAPAPAPSPTSADAVPPSPASTAPEPTAAASSSRNAEDAGPATAPARWNAAELRNAAASYPRISKMRGEQGQVLLRVRVLASGRADVIEVTRSSGYPRLDEAARDAVRDWRFVPARRGDQAVDSWLNVPIVFQLEDKHD